MTAPTDEQLTALRVLVTEEKPAEVYGATPEQVAKFDLVQPLDAEFHLLLP